MDMPSPDASAPNAPTADTVADTGTAAPARHRWQRRKHARASEILQAAEALMAERGSATMRMSEIAARAGITKGTIYLYFANKAEVLKSLADRQSPHAVAAE